jgi:hypothetical protein
MVSKKLSTPELSIFSRNSTPETSHQSVSGVDSREKMRDSGIVIKNLSTPELSHLFPRTIPEDNSFLAVQLLTLLSTILGN